MRRHHRQRRAVGKYEAGDDPRRALGTEGVLGATASRSLFERLLRIETEIGALAA
jgi:hypothetical protein